MNFSKTCLLLVMLVGLAGAGTKYYISPDRASFLQAITFCRRFGMNLVTIDSDEKNSKIYKHFVRLDENHEFYWTSGMFQNNTMTRDWYWLESDKEVEFTDWRKNDFPSEPFYIPNTDSCIIWGYYRTNNSVNGLWKTSDCKVMRRFICEKSYSI